MDMTQKDLAGGITKITLTGSFDIQGAHDVDLPMNVIAGSKDKVIVDFRGVDFLASIGVRVLVKLAKAVGNRGGTVAVIGPNAAAAKVLSSTGVDTIVRIVEDEPGAIAAVG